MAFITYNLLFNILLNYGRTGDKTINSRGGYDYWLVKLVYNKPDNFEIAKAQNKNSIVTGINGSLFSVYPNPAKDVVHVHTIGTAVISLVDQTGKILITKTISNNYVLNVSHLKPGLYYLKNNTAGVVQKIIIIR